MLCHQQLHRPNTWLYDQHDLGYSTMDPMYIVLIVKIWNVLDVNRLGDYICVCLKRVAPTEHETVGNDSCSIPEEEEELVDQ